MSNVSIRLAKHHDLSGVLELYQFLNPDDPKVDLDKTEHIWQQIITSEMTSVFVADMKGTIVSTCALAVIPNLSRGTRPYGIIENVITHPNYRRIGLGKSILATAVKAAWDAGCYKVMLATGSQKEETLRFYEQAGFERGAKTLFQIRRI